MCVCLSVYVSLCVYACVRACARIGTPVCLRLSCLFVCFWYEFIPQFAMSYVIFNCVSLPLQGEFFVCLSCRLGHGNKSSCCYRSLQDKTTEQLNPKQRTDIPTKQCSLYRTEGWGEEGGERESHLAAMSSPISNAVDCCNSGATYK